jgi:phosphate transport system substrate-binding protein
MNRLQHDGPPCATANDAPNRRRFLTRCSALAGAWVSGAAQAQMAQVDEYGDVALRGAGSTFVQPLMEAWVRQYRADPHQVLVAPAPNGGLGDALSNDGLDYEPVGSLAGIQRIRAGFVDFAASEMPLSADYLQRNGLMQFPWVIGGVAIVAIVPGVAHIKLDAPTIAGIFLGRITRWSDPEIVKQNPGAPLRDVAIAVAHRSDGSGTTFTFASYLNRNDTQWKQRMGSDLLLKWPLGKGYRGNDEMVRALKTTPHGIGYVNVVQARRAGLPVALLRNAHGQYVPPDPANISAAFAARPSASSELDALPIDAPGEHSYPLVATVFGMMHAPIRSTRQRRTADFIAWTLTRGGALANQIGYLSLPDKSAKATIERLARPF